MKQLIIKNGLYATLVLVGVHIVAWVVSDGEPNYEMGEIIGYTSMIICMVFVFLGIREYRNVELHGTMTFNQALGMGVLIALVPSLAFGLYDIVYILYLNPDFTNDYFNHYLDKMRNTLTAEEFEKARQQMEAEKEFWSNPLLQFIVMFLTVFVIGFIVALISSAILQTKSKKPIVS
ncbi:MAG: DUF4199 domain-containing protein [Bacteroidota bacterium]